MVSVFGRQRPANLCKFKASLVYIVPGQPELWRDRFCLKIQNSKSRDFLRLSKMWNKQDELCAEVQS